MLGEHIDLVCQHHGLKCAQDSDMDQLVSATRPAEIIRELKEALPTSSEAKPEEG
jgi:hypothetical protein